MRVLRFDARPLGARRRADEAEGRPEGQGRRRRRRGRREDDQVVPKLPRRRRRRPRGPAGAQPPGDQADALLQPLLQQGVVRHSRRRGGHQVELRGPARQRLARRRRRRDRASPGHAGDHLPQHRLLHRRRAAVGHGAEAGKDGAAAEEAVQRGRLPAGAAGGRRRQPPPPPRERVRDLRRRRPRPPPARGRPRRPRPAQQPPRAVVVVVPHRGRVGSHGVRPPQQLPGRSHRGRLRPGLVPPGPDTRRARAVGEALPVQGGQGRPPPPRRGPGRRRAVEAGARRAQGQEEGKEGHDAEQGRRRRRRGGGGGHEAAELGERDGRHRPGAVLAVGGGIWS
mmetsp:Transcript_38765/g.92769  ORF Transcript_38765/g.92769 Transcript_38765/m.92769 type:complete len:339 (-) Transcript_38765:250-1266(-)